MSGAPLHQFTAVAIGGRAMLIDGAPGIGKSSLALALIDRGAALIGDDGVALTAADGVLTARPAPATRGLLEVRGVGVVSLPLVPLPLCDGAPVALWLRLDPAAPRFVETAPRATICGVPIPQIALWPEGAALPLRAELALRVHGLALAGDGDRPAGPPQNP